MTLEEVKNLDTNEFNILQRVKYEDEYEEMKREQSSKGAKRQGQGSGNAPRYVSRQQMEAMEELMSGNLEL